MPDINAVKKHDFDVTSENLQAWLTEKIAEKLNLPASDISTELTFDEFGLDSVAAVSISGDLGELLNIDLPGTLLYEYPSIDELSAHLAKVGR